jgi:DNA-binding Lrp family transcriptional regulator
MSAVEIAERLGIDRTTVHRHLARLLLMEKVESKNGIWFAKNVERATKPLEKEIVIELPLPKDQWRQTAFLEAQAKELERIGLARTAEDMRIVLEKLKETRTIKIKGKNVDDLDLEKLGNLIQQASQKSSLVNFKGLFKRFRMPEQQAPKSSET